MRFSGADVFAGYFLSRITALIVLHALVARNWGVSFCTNRRRPPRCDRSRKSARLSVFAVSFDLAATVAVCGFGTIDILDVAGLLGSPVDKSPVVAEQAGTTARYRLLETIRLFAAERLAEAGPEQAAAVCAAYCAHYLAVAQTAAPHLAGPRQASWLARLDADNANLRRAARLAGEEPDGTTQVLRFSVTLRRYWSVRRVGEGEVAELLVPVLGRPNAATNPALFAEALFAAALPIAFSDLATSLQLAQQAADVAAGLGDDRLLVLSLGLLCQDYFFAGQPEQARALGQQAVERARRLGDDVLLGMSLFYYAVAVGAPGSAPLYAEAIACTERSGDLAVGSISHMAAGADALSIGKVPDARAHLEAAIRAAEAVGEPHLWASVNLGEVQRAEHDFDSARRTFEEVVRIGRRIGAKAELAFAILDLAYLAADLNDWHRAATLHGVAQALLDQTGVRGIQTTFAASKASTRHAPPSATKPSSGPTPVAWDSASTRPSTWPSRHSRPARNDAFCAPHPPAPTTHRWYKNRQGAAHVARTDNETG